MVLATLPSHGLYAPPQRRFIRRDLPEIAIPINAEAATINPGSAAWALSSSFGQLVASSAAEYVTNAIGVTARFGRALTTNVTVTTGMIWSVHLYTGAASSEVERARVIFGGPAARCSLLGVVDDAVTAQAFANIGGQVPMYGMRIPASTRITAKTATNVPSTNWTRNAEVWLLVYDATLIQPAHLWAWDEDQFVAGGDSYQNASRMWDSTPTALLMTSGAGAWTFSAWVQADAALDADYLIEGVANTREDDASTTADFVVQLGLGAAGSEVVQSESKCSRVGTTEQNCGVFTFTHPFIAYKGERLAIRVKDQQGSLDHEAVIFGKKIHGAF